MACILMTMHLFLGALAIVVGLKFLANQFRQVPRNGGPENLAFEVHKYSGLLAMALAIGFWVVVLFRIGSLVHGCAARGLYG